MSEAAGRHYLLSGDLISKSPLISRFHKAALRVVPLPTLMRQSGLRKPDVHLAYREVRDERQIDILWHSQSTSREE